MKKTQYIGWVALWALLLPWGAFGQKASSCSQMLIQAQRAYDDGKIQAVPGLLDQCIRSGFTQEERMKAYKLLTLAYLFANNNDMAEETFEKLLRLAPDFTVDKDADPIELVKLYNAYRTAPVLSFSAFVGPNLSNPASDKAYTLHSDNSSVGMYGGNIGLSTGVGVEIHANRHWSLQIQGIYGKQVFSMTQNDLVGFTFLNYREQNDYIGLPILLKYQFGQKKVVPYLFGGASAQWIFRGRAEAERQQDNGRDVKASGININEMRNRQQYGLIAGLGMKYKVKRTSLFASAQYLHGLNNMAISDYRYSNSDLLYRFGYIDHDFRISQFSVSFGLNYHLYNPKKLKRPSL